MKTSQTTTEQEEIQKATEQELKEIAEYLKKECDIDAEQIVTLSL